MKRKVPPTLIWSGEDHTYFWRNDEGVDNPLWYQDTDVWFQWLNTHRSFSFQGQHGHLNLLKEARLRGEEGYWYAYRSRGKRPTKKYAGRSADLTIERLEAIAQKLTAATALDSKTFEPQVSFLLPKLQPPPLPAFLVQRERLLVLLDTALQSSLTLLVAPPGSGKTTLVRQWMIERAAQRHSLFPPVAWVSLEAADNDPVRFWNYVLTACQFGQSQQAPLAQLLGNIQQSVQSTALEDMLSTFLNTLAYLPGEAILVLENYQVITSPQICESMVFFLTHLPTPVHLILLTRSEPSLPLTQLRASGRMCEVTGIDLRFSRGETLTFLQQIIPWSLSESLSYELDARLQGWAAGLRLLSLMFQGAEKPQDRESLLTLLNGGRHPFLEYFVSEVFLLQPPPLQDFLLHTCLLGSLNSSLCDALLGGNESAVHLHTLERANLYLEPLNGSPEQHLPQGMPQWYHYHPLFAEALLHIALQRFGVEQLRLWSEQASRWYVQHDLLPDAIETTLMVGESSQAVALIEQFIQIQYAQPSISPLQNTRLLQRWLVALPPDAIRDRPLLALSRAEGLFSTFILEQQPFLPQYKTQTEEMLRLAEDGFRSQGDMTFLRKILFIRALIERNAGNITQAADYIRQLEADAVPIRNSGLNLHVLGTEELLTGQVEKAIQIFLEARKLYEQLGSAPIMRSNSVLLGQAYFEHGEIYQAAEYFRQILTSARLEQDFDDIGDAQLGLAQISYERNQLEDAEQQALEASAMGERLVNEKVHVQAMLILARLEQVQGQHTQAQQRCRTLLTTYPPSSSTGLSLRHRLSLEIQETLAWLWLKSGDLTAVKRWESQRQSNYGWRGQSEREDLLVVRLLLVQEKSEEAREISERVVVSANAGGRLYIALQAQLLQSLADASNKRLPEARKRLHLVVAQACSEGYLRIFLDEGEPMQTLLQALAPTLHEETQVTYLYQLLLAFAQERTSGTTSGRMTLIEPLSRQEQRVLQRLCAGQTNQEIANELVVSVNTVRAQVRSIYQKLNVKNRVEASMLARQIKLL